MKEKLFRTRAWGNLVLIGLMGAACQTTPRSCWISVLFRSQRPSSSYQLACGRMARRLQ